jgi:3',5'-cyclic-AMP phosphodiesterase
MARIVVAQISDPHIPGPGDALFAGSDPVGNLTLALRHALRRTNSIVITGDCVARSGTDNEYEGLAIILKSVGVDVSLCAGNHDDSLKMQQIFSLPSCNGRLDYVVPLVVGKLVVLDTSRAGCEDGSLDVEQLEWLDDVLSDGMPALIAMHHPCFRVGGPTLDNVRLDNPSISGLSEVVGRHKVLGVVSGHAHMTVSAPFAGTTAYICPSVAYEFSLNGRDLNYRPGLPQYMEYSWGEDGSAFMARVVTVAPDESLLLMEHF